MLFRGAFDRREDALVVDKAGCDIDVKIVISATSDDAKVTYWLALVSEFMSHRKRPMLATL